MYFTKCFNIVTSDLYLAYFVSCGPRGDLYMFYGAPQIELITTRKAFTKLCCAWKCLKQTLQVRLLKLLSHVKLNCLLASHGSWPWRWQRPHCSANPRGGKRPLPAGAVYRWTPLESSDSRKPSWWSVFSHSQNTREKQFERTRDLLQLRASVHGWLVPFLWVCGRRIHHCEKVLQKMCVLSPWGLRSKDQEKGPGS